MFTVLHDDSIDNAKIAVFDLDSKQHSPLLRGGHAARYTATGHMIYAAKGQLHMTRLDLASLSITGETSALASVQMTRTAGSATANFDVSRTGTLVYVAAEQQRLRTIVWVDATVKRRQWLQHRGTICIHDSRRTVIASRSTSKVRIATFGCSTSSVGSSTGSPTGRQKT